jgi:hypothetical protein
LNGQVRVSVEGINTTEGTGGAGFYFDYGSFEEVFLGVAGQGAEAATPGVQSQLLGKSGGNRFSGELYVDGYTNALQASNLTTEHITVNLLRPGSNEVLRCCTTRAPAWAPTRTRTRTTRASPAHGNDRNGDRRYQAGEEVGAPTATTLAGSVTIDPNITHPFSHDAAIYVERQVREAVGARVGFVYKTEDDLIAQYNPGRSISAYTVPYTVVDPGVDGRTGTADDGIVSLLGVPLANAATLFPISNVTMNTPRFSRYKTVEASMNKRFGHERQCRRDAHDRFRHAVPAAHGYSRATHRALRCACPGRADTEGGHCRDDWKVRGA